MSLDRPRVRSGCACDYSFGSGFKRLAVQDLHLLLAF